jgi:hypothetical protein
LLFHFFFKKKKKKENEKRAREDVLFRALNGYYMIIQHTAKGQRSTTKNYKSTNNAQRIFFINAGQDARVILGQLSTVQTVMSL